MQPTDFEIHLTGDGSETLYSKKMQESYHSINGAVQESKHVFLEAGLRHCKPKTLHILEIGFGTGLNALLSWGEAMRSNLDVHYTALEAYPLPLETILKLDFERFEPNLPIDAFVHLHATSWGQSIVLEQGCFTLFKLAVAFTSHSFEDKYDLIFFDAFAPDKQPEMWDERLFLKLFDAMNEDGILVTYCAKGEVRRRMQRSGFTVERLPGPPGKREMIRAQKWTHQKER